MPFGIGTTCGGGTNGGCAIANAARNSTVAKTIIDFFIISIASKALHDWCEIKFQPPMRVHDPDLSFVNCQFFGSVCMLLQTSCLVWSGGGSSNSKSTFSSGNEVSPAVNLGEMTQA